MTSVLIRMAVALLLLEAGFVARGILDQRRSDASALFPPWGQDNRRSLRVILLLGEDDCHDAVSFVDLLGAIVADNDRISQIVAVAGSPEALETAQASLARRSSTLPAMQATFRQLHTLGVSPARHLARLLLVDSRGNLLLQTLVPASPKEAAAIVSLAATIVQRELARN